MVTDEIVGLVRSILDQNYNNQDVKARKIAEALLGSQTTINKDNLFANVNVHTIDGSCYVRCSDLVKVVKNI